VALIRVSAAEAIADLDRFDTIVDARSPAEFAEDRLPGAVNWPSLDDDERARVGTEYAQVSAFDAKKRGAALVARNVAGHVERHVLDKPRGWSPLVYCWRGGTRSGALATVLDQIGFRVHVLEGGYRDFRRAIVAALESAPGRLGWRVVCGPTGSGKSRLLHALAAAGAQVLDLEGLAHHRGSLLGDLPGDPQPSQRRFESLLWDALRRFDPRRPVYVESESKKVGEIRVPQNLIDAMWASPCVRIETPVAARVALLREEYAHFIADPASLEQRLALLTPLRGTATVRKWNALAREGDWDALVADLLLAHYDPTYLRSMQANYPRYGDATVIEVSDFGESTHAEAARCIVERCGA